MKMQNIKKSFFRLLNRTIGILNAESQKEILLRMQRDWIPEYNNAIAENSTTCPRCKITIPSEHFQHSSVEKLYKNVFIDCSMDPNEDEEIYGDVKYLVEYIICPKCKRKSEISKKELEVLDTYFK